jgi:hypothetical protein
MLLFIVLVFGVALAALYIGSKVAKARSLSRSLEKVYMVLVDESAQNTCYRDLIKHLKVNTRDGNVGKLYGLSPADPIRANGPIGEIAYISRLIATSGCGFVGHRLGSIKGLDVFEVASTDFSEWFILWFDMYWLTRDRVAPEGLRLSDHVDPWPDGGASGLSATNRFLSTFPDGIWEALLLSTEKMIGFAAVKPQIKSLVTRVVTRPQKHARLLEEVVVLMRAEGIGEDE